MASTPYTTGYEHWRDELLLLDALIQFRLDCRIELERDNPFDPMRGLLVTEEEVARLLNETAGDEALSDSLGVRQRIIQERRSEIDARLAANLAEHRPLPLLELAGRFGLLAFERQCVMLALAPELNRKYEKLFGYLQDDVTCKHPTADLALKLFGGNEAGQYAERGTFEEDGPLMKWIMEEGERAAGVLSKPLRLDSRIVSYLLGTSEFDHRLTPHAKPLPTPRQSEWPLLEVEELQERLLHFVRMNEARRPAGPMLIHLWGGDGAGKTTHAALVAASLGKPAYKLRLQPESKWTAETNQLLHRFFREARLAGAVVALEPAEPGGEEDAGCEKLLAWTSVYPSPVFWLTLSPRGPGALPAEEGTPVLQAELAVPDIMLRQRLWMNAGELNEREAEALAAKYRFTPGLIRRAAEHAAQKARLDGVEAAAGHYEQGARAQAHHRMGDKARRLNPRYQWSDLVLPEEQLDMLRQASAMMRYRGEVFGKWGFERKLSYGKGVSMLFAGPPGTGKTMAAEVMASELNMEAYKIDLSQIVSKYIGETEKNLRVIFDEAQRSHAILFFDEADAIFGKRSEVKDAHDKYANVETAYLLQQMEEYDGISILATNFQQNIDDAFMRRLSLVIKFPFPDAEHRARLWSSMVPSATPLSKDVDFELLGRKIEVAGGSIKNIVVTAAFMAASAGNPLGMRELVAAARQELRKTGKILLPGEWEGFF
ncbi:AAA family ATPase [Paenibacillus methanolicus]|uniref:ATPase family protein associated with various cellular activities (AAA) n=1 Tax=Paenibacillus methanolicus TaxID=582686 RepID=A0A5S5CIR3_9BACL|nr:AAA family ATPase [Paenibacillus methanolicus]TYP79679.1 ATPase family protein associated with various cellular activities (AAA) [Paenibacillus methanolicus]